MAHVSRPSTADGRTRSGAPAPSCNKPGREVHHQAQGVPHMSTGQSGTYHSNEQTSIQHHRGWSIVPFKGRAYHTAGVDRDNVDYGASQFASQHGDITPRPITWPPRVRPGPWFTRGSKSRHAWPQDCLRQFHTKPDGRMHRSGSNNPSNHIEHVRRRTRLLATIIEPMPSYTVHGESQSSTWKRWGAQSHGIHPSKTYNRFMKMPCRIKSHRTPHRV